jgi:hypothetical protein
MIVFMLSSFFYKSYIAGELLVSCEISLNHRDTKTLPNTKKCFIALKYYDSVDLRATVSLWFCGSGT